MRCSNFSEIFRYKRITNLGETIRPSDSKKERTCRIVDFAVPVDHRVNLKENEKKNKYPDLARELKKMWK